MGVVGVNVPIEEEEEDDNATEGLVLDVVAVEELEDEEEGLVLVVNVDVVGVAAKEAVDGVVCCWLFVVVVVVDELLGTG